MCFWVVCFKQSFLRMAFVVYRVHSRTSAALSFPERRSFSWSTSIFRSTRFRVWLHSMRDTSLATENALQKSLNEVIVDCGEQTLATVSMD